MWWSDIHIQLYSCTPKWNQPGFQGSEQPQVSPTPTATARVFTSESQQLSHKCLKDISAQALSSEHPKFPFSYWKAQRLELYNNKCIHKIIKCLYCTIYFAVKTCLFLFNLKGFSVFSHVKHEHESHQLLFKKIQASSSHNNKKKTMRSEDIYQKVQQQTRRVDWQSSSGAEEASSMFFPLVLAIQYVFCLNL